jgi:hypothetical protein
VVRFDAYVATTTAAKASDVLPWLARCAGDTVHMGKGFHTFSERIWVENHAGDQVASVCFGGTRQGDRIMVEVKGDRTPDVVEVLRGAFAHRCTRVDSCVDVERPGAFEALLVPVLQVKAEHKLYGQKLGDWEFPELGRTQELGARSSAVRARLYEKGRQPEYRHLDRPNLARLEVQVRPAKDAKSEYSRLSALEVWGASKWTRQLAGAVLAEHLDPHPPGTVRKDTKRDQAVRWMVRQYGPHLTSLADDLGGWDCLGLTLREMLAEHNQRRRRGLA